MYSPSLASPNSANSVSLTDADKKYILEQEKLAQTFLKGSLFDFGVDLHDLVDSTQYNVTCYQTIGNLESIPCVIASSFSQQPVEQKEDVYKQLHEDQSSPPTLQVSQDKYYTANEGEETQELEMFEKTLKSLHPGEQVDMVQLTDMKDAMHQMWLEQERKRLHKAKSKLLSNARVMTPRSPSKATYTTSSPDTFSQEDPKKISLFINTSKPSLSNMPSGSPLLSPNRKLNNVRRPSFISPQRRDSLIGTQPGSPLSIRRESISSVPVRRDSFSGNIPNMQLTVQRRESIVAMTRNNRPE